MKKFLKWFLGITAVCSIIGLLIAYFCRDNENEELDDYDEYEEDEDFDLDNDLKPVENREYVPLNKSEETTEETEEINEESDKVEEDKEETEE